MTTGKREIQIRCKACGSRFAVLPMERFAQCPPCHQECPFSSVFEVDGGVIVCDVCERNPKCVEVCQKQAIQFI